MGSPLLTKYALSFGVPETTLEKLWSVRQMDPKEGPVKLNLGPLWNKAFQLKNFQTQAVAHLMLMPRMVIGDQVGLGKSIEAIAGMCYHCHKNPALKVLVLTTKSVAKQFAKEIGRFSHLTFTVMSDKGNKQKKGVKLSPHEHRMKQMRNWLSPGGPQVMVAKYTSLIGQREALERFDNSGKPDPGGKFDRNGYPITTKDGKELISKEMQEVVSALYPHRANLLVVFDEVHKLKNKESQTRLCMMQVQQCCYRAWGLSASLIKNDAQELYNSISAIGIRPCGTLRDFEDRFCTSHLVRVGARFVKQLDGYQDMDVFKGLIRPFVYARSQKQSGEPLPVLLTKYYELDLSDKQAKLLLEDIPSGAFTLQPGVRKVLGEIQLVERDPNNKMTQLSVNQLVSNHPCLLESLDQKRLFTKELSPKEDALMDLLEGDLSGEKVIVFTKFKTHIDRLEHLFKQRGTKFLRITGDENEDEREEAKTKFQESGDHNLIVINSAAMEGVNLQQSAHMVCLDLPWSFGDLMQLVGRMLRIASPHSCCTLHVMVAKGSVDEYVVSVLLSKKSVMEIILGESHSAGILEEEARELDLSASLDRDMTDAEFSKLLQVHVKDIQLGEYLGGSKIRAAQRDTYTAPYEKKKKEAKPRSNKLADAFGL